jgi:hypothetical protein
MCCEVLLMDFQANYFVIDLQGNFVVSSLLISNVFFFQQRWVVDLCCGILFYFSFCCSGCKCDVWKVDLFCNLPCRLSLQQKHLFINKIVRDVKHSC